MAGEIAEENEQRSAEELLMATLDATADDKLTRFALRLAPSGHVGIPRTGEFDFLTEAEAAIASPQPQKTIAAKKNKKPALVKGTSKKAQRGKKKIAA